MSTSVIITTHRRYETINEVCQAWLKQPVDQVWLVDGRGKARGNLSYFVLDDDRFELWPLWKDHGTRTDYALAHLTDGDYVCLADDDVVPKAGLVQDFHLTMARFPDSILGLIGRTFHGPSYYEDTKFYAANQIHEPVRVGFAGVVYFAHRKFFGFDTRGMHRNTDDLWWQMRVFPSAPKYVVPTKSYENLPSSKDGMFHAPNLRHIRADFYREHYVQNYEPEGKTF